VSSPWPSSSAVPFRAERISQPHKQAAKAAMNNKQHKNKQALPPPSHF
jgi:hypothetical protein